jgi:hypothetical protein
MEGLPWTLRIQCRRLWEIMAPAAVSGKIDNELKNRDRDRYYP